MSANKRGGMTEDEAWDALGMVQDHPQVRAWLAEVDALGMGLDSEAAPQDRRPWWSRWTLGIAASVVLSLGIVWAAYVYWTTDSYQTEVGEQRDVTLADGSRMTLNTNTAVAVRYSKARRFVEMKRGEALFVVKTDTQRPFEVAAGGMLTRALGTEFNVDLRSAKVTVSVLEGAVQVVPVGDAVAKSPAVLRPEGGSGESPSLPISALSKGQAIEVRKTDGHMQQRKADLRRIDAWRTRRLEFTDTSLTDAVEEFNRYATVRLVVGTPDLASVRVSGIFRIGDTESFLYSLREALHLKTLEGSGEVVLMRGDTG